MDLQGFILYLDATLFHTLNKEMQFRHGSIVTFCSTPDLKGITQ